MRSLLLIFLICPVLRASNIEPTISGKIIDSHGKPVAGAVISAQWKLQAPGDSVVPFGPRAVTEASGHFSSLWIGSMSGRSAFMVYDSLRKEGAVIDMATPDLGKPLVVRLKPLQTVHFDLRVPASIDSTIPQSQLSTRSGVIVVGLSAGSGSLLLPPGKYDLFAVTEEDTRPVRASFSVSDKEVSLPILELKLSPIAQHYGRGTPDLSTLLDMDHSPYNIGDLRGHWTLLYFWADWCGPCVNEGIPKLIAFANEHSGLHDQFRIIAIRERRPGEKGDWDDFHSKTLKFENSVWHGVPPFVMAYDATMRMTKDWGIDAAATTALINPNGDLVQRGNLSTLATELALR